VRKKKGYIYELFHNKRTEDARGRITVLRSKTPAEFRRFPFFDEQTADMEITSGEIFKCEHNEA